MQQNPRNSTWPWSKYKAHICVRLKIVCTVVCLQYFPLLSCRLGLIENPVTSHAGSARASPLPFPPSKVCCSCSVPLPNLLSFTHLLPSSFSPLIPFFSIIHPPIPALSAADKPSYCSSRSVTLSPPARLSQTLISGSLSVKPTDTERERERTRAREGRGR